MKVPSPGESISEVEIAEWLVKDGDFVEKDQTIAEVESDKATLDLPAEESGVITLKAQEGDNGFWNQFHIAVSGNPQPKVSSEMIRPVRPGFRRKLRAIYQYARDYFPTTNQ